MLKMKHPFNLHTIKYLYQIDLLLYWKNEIQPPISQEIQNYIPLCTLYNLSFLH
jgi:hypothetical protein